MPHNGPRGSPVTERRNTPAPVFMIAADTMLPAGTVTSTPLTDSLTVSGMGQLRSHARRQVRPDRNRRRAIQDLIDEEFRSSQRRRYAEPFVSRRQIQAWMRNGRSDQRQLVRRRRAKTSPHAQRRKLPQTRQILDRPRQHATQNSRLNRRVIDVILPRRSDQQLTRLSRLNIERDRICRQRMRARQVAKFNQLMSQKMRIAIRNHEMPFAF